MDYEVTKESCFVHTTYVQHLGSFCVALLLAHPCHYPNQSDCPSCHSPCRSYGVMHSVVPYSTPPTQDAGPCLVPGLFQPTFLLTVRTATQPDPPGPLHREDEDVKIGKKKMDTQSMRQQRPRQEGKKKKKGKTGGGKEKVEKRQRKAHV